MEYKEINGSTYFSDDDWQTCKVGFNKPEPIIGDLTTLTTTNKDTLSGLYNYYAANPLVFMESVLCIKLMWYQKIYLKHLFKVKGEK